MKKTEKIVCVAIVCAFCACSLWGAPSHSRRWELPEKELKDLDNAISNAREYDMEFKQDMRKLADAYNNYRQEDIISRQDLAIRLADSYRAVNTDSALKYSSIALDLGRKSGDPNRCFNGELASIEALATAGMFTDARNAYDSISRIPMSIDHKVKLWKTGRMLYSYAASYVENHPHYFQRAQSLCNQCVDSLMTNMDSKSDFYIFLKCERLVNQGKYADAKKQLEALLSNHHKGENIYGMVAFQMALVAENQGDQTEYAAYLARAAESDIIGCVKEGMALPSLADWLYEQGEHSDAFRYINHALEDAKQGNVRMRTINIAYFMPHIDEAYREKINSSRDELMIYVVMVTVLVILLLVLVGVLRREAKRSREKEQRLSMTSKLKDSYIGSFIGLCSMYADQLENLEKLVVRKISAGQTNELVKLVKSGKFTEGVDDENLYKTVDSAFLHLYPDFVNHINSLLREEERFSISQPYTLTPELRIYAFVKLGVTESTKIAQILHYSVSTVYAYRNRMRNKAIDRDNFDANVASLELSDFTPA